VYGPADGFHRPAQVAPDDVRRDDDFPFHVLAADRIGAGRGFDVGQVAERYLDAVAVHEQVADFFYRVAPVVGHLDRKVERIVALVHLRYGLSGERRGDVLVELRHGDAVQGEHLPPRRNLQLRPFHLLFHDDVGDSLDVRYGLPYPGGERVHPVQVFAEKFDGDVGLGAGEHGVDAVRNGLADLYGETAQVAQPVAHIGEEFVARTPVEHERRF